ncbi:MAG: serine hydrolase domain-containing protein [Planctomycetota bacterium]
MFAPFQVVAQSPTEDPELARRLIVLRELIERRRVHHRIPGVALGIVRDGSVVFAEGFGCRDLETDARVTPKTVFQIASATKPLTSTLIAMMVDREEMQWDDPITKHCPNLKFTTKGESEITIRDLLSHRSGFGRMPVLFMGRAERRDVVLQATNAKPTASHRDSFQYSNVMYTAAGVAAGKAVGNSWDELMHERVFRPLGMFNTTTSIEQIHAKAETSRGYRWVASRQEHEEIPMRNADAIGPAGSVNSNVLDLCKWIQLLLNEGTVEGRKLVDRRRIEETWSPQIPMTPLSSYGLGWMLQERQGAKVVEHGGNLAGFSSEVVLVPEKRLGFVMLTNLDYTPFQDESIGLILDTLLRPLSDVEAELKESIATASLDTRLLQGNYVAAMDVFGNAIARIKPKGCGIEMQLGPGVKIECKPMGESGVKFRSLDQSWTIEFGSLEEGRPQSMNTLCNGQASRFVRVPRKSEQVMPAQEILAGRYFHQPWGYPIQVDFHEGVLVAKLDGERHLFKRVNENAVRWQSVSRPDDFELRFLDVKDTKSGQLEFVQPGPDIRLNRESPIVTFEQLIQLVRKAYGKHEVQAQAIRLKGSADFINQGARGVVTIDLSEQDEHRTVLDCGEGAVMELSSEPKDASAWDVESQPARTTKGELDDANFHYPWLVAEDWETRYPGHSIEKGPNVDGESTYSLELFEENTLWPNRIYLIASTSGRIVREQKWLYPDGDGESISYSDFRQAHGRVFPFRHVLQSDVMGELILQLESAERLPE